MDFHELMEWLDQMLWIGIDNSWCLLGVIYDIVKSFLVWSMYVMYGNVLEFCMTDYYGQCLDVWTGNMKLIDK